MNECIRVFGSQADRVFTGVKGFRVSEFKIFFKL